MKKVRYSVAMSLDGFIAGPDGEYDWILMDPDIDFAAIYDQFDTIVMGRRTFEPMAESENAEMTNGMFGNMKVYVFSTTLDAAEYPDVTIVREKANETIISLRQEDGKDIWLFGGGVLFKKFIDEGLVDTVEVAVIPILLGGGIPLFPPPARQTKLHLQNHKVYEKTGTVSLEYVVVRGES